MNFEGIPRKLWTKIYNHFSVILKKHMKFCGYLKTTEKFKRNFVEILELLWEKSAAIFFEK